MRNADRRRMLNIAAVLQRWDGKPDMSVIDNSPRWSWSFPARNILKLQRQLDRCWKVAECPSIARTELQKKSVQMTKTIRHVVSLMSYSAHRWGGTIELSAPAAAVSTSSVLRVSCPPTAQTTPRHLTFVLMDKDRPLAIILKGSSTKNISIA